MKVADAILRGCALGAAGYVMSGIFITGAFNVFGLVLAMCIISAFFMIAGAKAE